VKLTPTKITPILPIDSFLIPYFAFHLQGIAGNDGKDGKPGSLGEPVMQFKTVSLRQSESASSYCFWGYLSMDSLGKGGRKPVRMSFLTPEGLYCLE